MSSGTPAGPGYTVALPPGFTVVESMPAMGLYRVLPPGSTPFDRQAQVQLRAVQPFELQPLLQNTYAFENPDGHAVERGRPRDHERDRDDAAAPGAVPAGQGAHPRVRGDHDDGLPRSRDANVGGTTIIHVDTLVETGDINGTGIAIGSHTVSKVETQEG